MTTDFGNDFAGGTGNRVDNLKLTVVINMVVNFNQSRPLVVVVAVNPGLVGCITDNNQSALVVGGCHLVHGANPLEPLGRRAGC